MVAGLHVPESQPIGIDLAVERVKYELPPRIRRRQLKASGSAIKRAKFGLVGRTLCVGCTPRGFLARCFRPSGRSHNQYRPGTPKTEGPKVLFTRSA